MDAPLIQPTEIRVRREAGIKNEFLGQVAGSLFPERHKAQHVVVLITFPQLRIGIAEDLRRGVLREKRQDPLLPAGALRDINSTCLAQSLEEELDPRRPGRRVQGHHHAIG